MSKENLREPDTKGNVPLVSVIVPVYKVEKYLRKCLDSLLGQTLEQIEVICVNDASPDGCLTILREYEQKDARVRVIDFPENRGVSAARNAGLDAARGEWVAVADSDDWVEKEMYERLYATVRSASDMDVAYCNYMEVSKDGFTKIESPDYTGGADRSDILLYRMYHCQCLFRKSLLDDKSIRYPENLICLEDSVFLISVFLTARRIGRIDYYGYYYLTNPNGISRMVNDSRQLHIEVIDVLPKALQTLGVYQSNREKVDWFCIYVCTRRILDSISLFYPPNYKYLKEVRKILKQRYPHYKRNTYYKREYSLKKRLLLNLLLQCGSWGPHVYVFMLEVGVKLKLKSVLRAYQGVIEYKKTHFVTTPQVAKFVEK